MRSGLLSGLLKNYHDTCQCYSEKYEGFALGIRMRSFKATDQAGFFKYTLIFWVHTLNVKWGKTGGNWTNLEHDSNNLLVFT